MVSVNGTLQVEKKKWDFAFLYKNLQEILNENDNDQAENFAKNALREAQTQENAEWAVKFQEILNQLAQTKNLYEDPSQESKTDIQAIHSKNDDLTKVKGIGPNIALKLQTNGFNTIRDIVISTPEQIACVPGIGVATASKMITNAKECLSEGKKQSFPKSKNLSTAIPKDPTPCKELKSQAHENKAMSNNLNEWFDPIKNQKTIGNEIDSNSLNEERIDFIPATREIYTEENPIEIKKVVEEEFEGETQSNREEYEVKPLRNQVTTSYFTNKVDTESKSYFSQKKASDPRVEDVFIPLSKSIQTPEKPPIIDKNQYYQTIARIIKDRQFHEISLNNQDMREFQRGIDNLACKIITISNNTRLILLIPIKFLSSQNPLIISEMRVLKPVSASDSTSLQYIQDSVAEAHTRQLKKVSDAMFDNFINEGPLHALLSRNFGLDAIVHKGFKQKPLFLASGEVQYEIIIDPILVTNNSVLSIEKTVPFPYQHSSNLHFIELEELYELMEYLKQKHSMLMTQDSSSNSLVEQLKMKNAFYKNIKNYSVPFLFFGGTFLLFLLMQMGDLVRLFISLGFALIFIYGGVIALVLYQYFKATNKMTLNYKTPHHKKQFERPKEDLILISEDFSEDWIVQLEYEVKEKVDALKKNKFTTFQTEKSKIKTDKENDQHDLEQFEVGTSVMETEFEREQDLNTLNDPILSKYRSFLDD